MVGSSSGSWIGVVVDSFLQLTRVAAAEYFCRLDTIFWGWMQTAADSIMWLTRSSSGWISFMANQTTANSGSGG